MRTDFKLSLRIVAAAFLLFLLISQGCKKNSDSPADPSSGNPSGTADAGFFSPHMNFGVVDLVADAPITNQTVAHLDPNLVNAWGMSFGLSGGIWISSNENGVSTVYDITGNTLHPPVDIPFGSVLNGGKPTGQVFNSSDAFHIPGEIMQGPAAKFIFATENGTLAACSTASGDVATIVADRSAMNAVYKGLAIGRHNDAMYLYAADFHNGRVDVFDRNFQLVTTMPFADATIPAGFAPFNIKNMGGRLFVTYAKQLAPDNMDDQAGPGNGYVNIFTTGGVLVKRFVSQGNLNSPWGMAIFKGNNGFGRDDEEMAEDEDMNIDEVGHTILIANFGDGHINAYNRNGEFISALMSNGQPVVIDGLWSISYPTQHDFAYKGVRRNLFFTAGPAHESHGLFGYVLKTKTEQTMK